MKKKIIILGICLVLAAGTVAAVASGAYNNQNIDIKSTLSKVFSSEKSEGSLVQKDSVQTDSISLNDDQNKSVISTDISDETIALYPSNFYSMVEILKSNISDTASIADILASYLYLRDIYGLNNEQLEYIAGLITNGADPNSILDIAYFWADTCEDITIIEQIYNKKGDYEGGRFWIENAYNNITKNVHGVLKSEEINNYLSLGVTVSDIQNANILSRKGVYSIKQILDRIAGGDTMINIINEVYGTSISQPVSLFGISENKKPDESILNSKELAALENKQIEESASEILSDEKTAERLVEKRNEKNAELVKQLINEGILEGRIDKDLGVVFDE